MAKVDFAAMVLVATVEMLMVVVAVAGVEVDSVVAAALAELTIAAVAVVVVDSVATLVVAVEQRMAIVAVVDLMVKVVEAAAEVVVLVLVALVWVELTMALVILVDSVAATAPRLLFSLALLLPCGQQHAVPVAGRPLSGELRPPHVFSSGPLRGAALQLSAKFRPRLRQLSSQPVPLQLYTLHRTPAGRGAVLQLSLLPRLPSPSHP